MASKSDPNQVSDYIYPAMLLLICSLWLVLACIIILLLLQLAAKRFHVELWRD